MSPGRPQPISSAQPVRSDLNEVVTEALAVFNGRLDGIAIHTSFAPGLAPVNLDREQFPPVQDHPNPSQTIGWLNIAALIFLLVGLMSLATFAAYNVWKTPIVPEQKRKPFTASSVVELIVSAGVVSRNTLDAGAT